MQEENEMKENYDFSDAVQGKFYRPLETHQIPFYLEPKLQKDIIKKASEKNIDATIYINSVIKKALDLSL